MRQFLSAGIALTILCAFFMPLTSGAQCTLECLPGPIPIPLGPTCQATVQPTQLLGPGNDCTGSFTLEIYDLSGAPIPGNLITGLYLNQTLAGQVTHVGTGQTCVTTITPVDLISPNLAIPCPDLNISCNADTSYMVLPTPGFTDNCGPLTITVMDNVTGGDCPLTSYVIERTWTARDQGNNSASCVQEITLTYQPLLSVNFPADITLDCAGSPFDLDVSGQPTLDGAPLVSGPFCDFTVNFLDADIPPSGPGLRTIERTWNVENCLGQNLSEGQIITVIDNTPPIIFCPDDLVIPADPGFCNVTTLLPSVDSVSDACTEVVNVLISTPFGPGQGPHIIPVGTHVITYTAIDVLGNTASCTMSVTVEDIYPPTVSCQNLAPALQPSGTLTLSANTFILAQSDNCGVVLREIRRLDGPEPFGPNVTFECADVGQEIPVRVRVYDAEGLVDSCDAIAAIQDKTPPLILECPADTILDCGVFNGDPTSYPKATFFDECGLMDQTETITDNRDKCGVGPIIRTFTAIDLSNNTTTCVQVMTIVNNNELAEDLITWPEDYMINDCVGPESLHPDSIPEPFNRPVVDGSVCSIIAIGYKDETLIVTNPGCLKIFRTWTVVDCCIYDVGDPNPQGIFTYTQLLKVVDKDPPVIDCPDQLPVSVGPNCTVIFANLPDITADDCNPLVKITNNSPFSIEKKANASGNYPLGETPVRFTASDECGNFSFCDTKVVVSDFAPPKPLCLHGLTTDIGFCDGEVLVKIKAEYFNQNSTDNCSPSGTLHFSFSSDINDTLIMYTCDDLDSNVVQMWVTDEAGNQAFCQTYIIVQDNMNLCPGGKPSSLSGMILDPMGEAMHPVKVSLSGKENAEVINNPDGTFAFLNLDEEGPYEIAAYKTEQPLQGVSTYDLLLIQKHLLGAKALTDPHKMLAADANMSGGISISDIIYLRHWLLNPKEDMSPQIAWRFVNPAVPMNMQNPFLTQGAEKLIVAQLGLEAHGLEMMAVKVGDVSGDAFSSEFNAAETRNEDPLFTLNTTDQVFETGQQVTWTLRAGHANDLQSLQCALGWDPAVLSFSGVQTMSSALGLEPEHFGMTEVGQGNLRMSWSEGHGVNLETDQELLKIRFTALRDGRLSENAYLNHEAMTPEVVWDDQSSVEAIPGNSLALNWEKEGLKPEDEFKLYPNKPNPFRDMTMIGFRIPEAAEVILRLFTPDGQAITEFRGKYPAGYHEISVPGEILPPNGLIFYRLDVPGFTDTQKMVRQ